MKLTMGYTPSDKVYGFDRTSKITATVENVGSSLLVRIKCPPGTTSYGSTASNPTWVSGATMHLEYNEAKQRARPCSLTWTGS